MYLKGALRELQYPQDSFRNAEQRLSGLLGTFNYARPIRSLDVKYWKAMTCVLVNMVMPTSDNQFLGQQIRVPPSVQAIQVTGEEYRYLVQKSIHDFSRPAVSED